MEVVGTKERKRTRRRTKRPRSCEQWGRTTSSSFPSSKVTSASSSSSFSFFFSFGLSHLLTQRSLPWNQQQWWRKGRKERERKPLLPPPPPPLLPPLKNVYRERGRREGFNQYWGSLSLLLFGIVSAAKAVRFQASSFFFSLPPLFSPLQRKEEVGKAERRERCCLSPFSLAFFLRKRSLTWPLTFEGRWPREKGGTEGGGPDQTDGWTKRGREGKGRGMERAETGLPGPRIVQYTIYIPLLHLKRTRRNEPLRIRFLPSFRPILSPLFAIERTDGGEGGRRLRIEGERERERKRHCNSQPRPIKLTYCLLACLLLLLLSLLLP